MLAANTPQWRETVATLQRLDRVHYLRRSQSRLENIMCALAVIAIACVIVESELLWLEVERYRERLRSQHAALELSISFIVLKTILSASTLALVTTLVLLYRSELHVLVESQQVDPHASWLHMPTNLQARFLLELLVCACHVPPGVSSFVSVDWQRRHAFFIDQLDALVFLRIYVVGRCLRNTLGFSTATSRFTRHLIRAFHSVDVTSVWFTLKCAFRTSPFTSTLAALLVDWMLTSAALNLFERGSNDALTNGHDAVWLAIVTMTSVGYGEIAPETLGGKLTIVVGALVGGTIITCLLRVVLIDALLVAPQEQVVLDVVAFNAFQRTHKHAAAFVIQRAWRWFLKRTSRNKHRMYAAADAARLLRFTMHASAVVGTTATTVSASDGGGYKTLPLQLETLTQQLETRHVGAMRDLHATSELLRNIER